MKSPTTSALTTTAWTNSAGPDSHLINPHRRGAASRICHPPVLRTAHERRLPRLPGGETGNDLLDRYVPVVTELRVRYLDDHDWNGDIVVISHGAAIRLASAVLAGVDADFALDNHLSNTESVVLAPITDGRWSCLRWGALTPPFYPEAESTAVADAVHAGTDPMG